MDRALGGFVRWGVFFGLGVLGRTAPAEMSRVDDDTIGVAELHFIKGIRLVLIRSAHEVFTAGVLDLGVISEG